MTDFFYSRFASLDNPQGIIVEETWERFRERLSVFVVVDDKRGVGLFCTTRFGGSGRRLMANAELVSALILDVDNAIVANGEKIQTFPLLKPEQVSRLLHCFEHVIVSSHNHTEHWPRYRVILPLARPIPASKWRQAASRAVEELGLSQARGLDPVYMKPAQAYFWPSHRPGAPRVFLHNAGPRLSIVVDRAPTMLMVDGLASARSTFTPDQVSRYWALVLPTMEQAPGEREWKAPCPIHGGRNNKFYVNAATGDWYCFSGCQRGGSLIEFERYRLEGGSHGEARRAVYRLLGIESDCTPTPVRKRFIKGGW